MVFKVKQRGKNNYNNVTKKSERGLGFPFTTNKELQKFTSVPDRELNYSYNWPYDFFSLIELAQLESGYEFTPVKASEQASNLAALTQQQTTQQVTQGTQSPPQQKTTVDIDDAELTPF